jgi:hypothetical protein
VLIILYGMWSLLWEYRQFAAIMRAQTVSGRSNGRLIVGSLHQELTQLMTHFEVSVNEWSGSLQPEAILLHELFMMNLYVSLEDVQQFAGKEGAEQARKAYPVLREWAGSRDARHAVWHAGQVLRAAAQHHPKTLRDFSAVAVYHASLAFWAYGVISRASLRAEDVGKMSTSTSETVWLDGEDGPSVQRFISLGRGVPAIRRHTIVPDGNTATPLCDSRAVMEVITRLLGKNGGSNDRAFPPLVSNLSQLMSDLGSAAAAIRRP